MGPCFRLVEKLDVEADLLEIKIPNFISLEALRRVGYSPKLASIIDCVQIYVHIKGKIEREPSSPETTNGFETLMSTPHSAADVHSYLLSRHSLRWARESPKPPSRFSKKY